MSTCCAERASSSPRRCPGTLQRTSKASERHHRRKHFQENSRPPHRRQRLLFSSRPLATRRPKYRLTTRRLRSRRPLSPRKLACCSSRHQIPQARHGKNESEICRPRTRQSGTTDREESEAEDALLIRLDIRMAEAQQHLEAAKLIPHFENRVRLHAKRRLLRRPDERVWRRSSRAIDHQHAASSRRSAQEVALRHLDIDGAKMEKLHLLIFAAIIFASLWSCLGLALVISERIVSRLVRWLVFMCKLQS